MDSLRCLIIFSRTAVTCASSSVMRSSTSRCLMAACKRRMTARRSFSPDRIAVFMSSVMRSLSVIAGASSARTRTRRVFTRAVALEVTLHGGSLLALTLLRRLLIEFAAPKLRQHARFFARALKTAQGGIEILVFTHSNARHRNLNPLIFLEFCHDLPGAGVAIL